MASKQGTYTYEWPRPALTVDAILITKSTPYQVLLIQRKQDPYAGAWALPGGFVDEMEPLDKAATRELQEETSVDPSSLTSPLIQIGAFGNPGRDPRGWTVGVAFATFVGPPAALGVRAADDAQAAEWFPIDSLPELAFDHKQMLKLTFEKMSRQCLDDSESELRQALERASSILL